MRVGGGYVFAHDPRAIEEAELEASGTRAIRATISDKDQKISRLQQADQLRKYRLSHRGEAQSSVQITSSRTHGRATVQRAGL